MEALPDDSFFNIIRLYLGDVKTPYNKQRLIQQLASFIRDKNNLNNILSLLDDFDLTVLTALSVISNANQKSIVEFFSTSYSIAEIYTELLNLTERLLIYSEKNPFSGKESLKINPLLEEELRPLLNIKRILPDCVNYNFSTDDIFAISPNFLAAFISYIKVYGCSCKNDGTLKKNHLTKLDELFPGKTDCLQLIFTAFSNLGLIREGKKSFEFDDAKIKSFAQLSEAKQYAFICVAASSRLSRDGLKKEGQLLLDTLSSIPENGLTKNILLRLAFLVGSRIDEGPAFGTKSRFTKMLEAAKATETSSDEGIQALNVFERMLNNAITLGLLTKIGNDENGDGIFICNQTIKTEIEKENIGYSFGSQMGQGGQTSTEKIPVLNIDSTFTVTLMPGLKLSQLLPLTSIFVIKSCNVVSEFEITKASISNAFDAGMNPEEISKQLLQYTNYDLPQNLQITIEDWYNSYSSAMLYSGYVLKVSKENISLVENNPKIKHLIKEKLAEGIYLLSVSTETEVVGFMKDSSLDFMGNIRTSTVYSETVTFPLLRAAHPLAIKKIEDLKAKSGNSELTAQLENALEKMDLQKQVKENLLNKIRNKKIVSQAQLSTTSTRTEILETDGMDYAGKVHLIEAAIDNSELIEIQIPSTNSENGQTKFVSFVGKPLHLIKNEREVLLNFKAESGLIPEKMDDDAITLPVSRITYLKRLRL